MRLISHWQNETFSYIAIFNVVIKCHSVKSNAFLVKIYCIFTPGNRKIDIYQSCQRLACELSNLRFFNNLLVDQLCHTWLLIVLIFLFHLIFLLFLLFRFLNIESNFAHAIIISNLLSCSLNYDIRFIDG